MKGLNIDCMVDRISKEIGAKVRTMIDIHIVIV